MILSLLYGELFTKDVVFDPQFSDDEIKVDLDRRKLHSIPPGYKDTGIGDLLIWHTILKIGSIYKKHVLFISGDEKADWFHQSNKQALYPRYELLDEFRRYSEHQTFHIVRFSTFLDLFGASKQVVDEVRKDEAHIQTDQDPKAKAERRRRALEAIAAVGIWLMQKFPDRIVTRRSAGGFDLIITAERVIPVAVNVQFFQE